MYKFISTIVVFFAVSVCASLPDIVAFVNDSPITKHDYKSRKKMINEINNIDVSDPLAESSLNIKIMDELIEEELLRQFNETQGRIISDEQVNNEIKEIEQRSNMPKGGMQQLFKEKELDIESFKKKLKGGIIKHSILASISDSISVSPAELDVAIVNTDLAEPKVEAWVFTSINNTIEDYKKMQTLQGKLKNCNNIDKKLYDGLAIAEKFDSNFDQMPLSTKSVIYDTKAGNTTSVYKENDKYKLVLVCKKDAAVSTEDFKKIKILLSNKKLSQKATKFIKDLKARADIKIMTTQ
jgi:parvulin-like peptidyl-prolyl isomerase